MPHTCATAPEVVFETLEDLKAHYHTDWHRYNLKRKVLRVSRSCRGLLTRRAGAVGPEHGTQIGSSYFGLAQVAGLPMLTLKMFERVVNQTVALAAAAEEAELKRGARRQGARRVLCNLRLPHVTHVRHVLMLRLTARLQGKAGG